MNLLHRLRCKLYRRRLRDPDFAFLCAPYAGEELVCLDLETSSLDPRTCEIISIGAVRIRKQRLLLSQKLDLRVRPQGRLDREAVRAHWLRPMDLANGLPPREALTQLLRFIGARPLVGYFLEFDLAVINRYLRPWLGIALPNRRIEVSARYYNHKARGRVGAHVDLSFGAITRELDLPLLPQHDAVNDAVMAGLMYLKLRQLENHRVTLFERLSAPVRASDNLIRG